MRILDSRGLALRACRLLLYSKLLLFSMAYKLVSNDLGVSSIFDDADDEWLSQVSLCDADIKEVKPNKTDRFKQVTSDELHELQKSRQCVNSKRSTSWALNVYTAWAHERNCHSGPDGDQVPVDISHTAPSILNYWLCYFVVEARRVDGGPYPPNSLYGICCGLMRYLKEDCERNDCNMMDTRNDTFRPLRNTLDAQMKLLTNAGVGTVKNQALPFSETEETLIWDKVLDCKSSLSFSYAVFFINCKVFTMRGRDEHSNLMVEQYSFGKDELGDYVKFSGRNNKTNQGGLYHRKIAFKEIKQYSVSDSNTCAYSILKNYLDLVPKVGPFYRRPLASKDGKIRFSIQKVGKNLLATYMSQICDIAGVVKHTNHSGKVTAATRLFEKNVDEQLIMQRTGHRSTDGVRAYKRPSNELLKNVSDLLDPSTHRTFVKKKEQETKMELPKTEINKDQQTEVERVDHSTVQLNSIEEKQKKFYLKTSDLELKFDY